MVIFPIRFDLSDFLYPSFPTTKKRTAPLIQQVRTNQVNKVKCLLLKIPAIVYFLESITEFPLVILGIKQFDTRRIRVLACVAGV